MDDLVIKLDELKFDVDRSVRYHMRRRSHYDRWHRIILFGIILLGSASVAQFSQTVKIGGIPGTVIWGLLAAILAALDLVVGFSNRARDHEILYRDFTKLLSTITSTRNPTWDQVSEWEKRWLDLSVEEQPIFWAVEASCYNEATIALGRQHHGLVKLSRFHRLLMNYRRFEKDEEKLAGPTQTAGAEPAAPLGA